jgi:hypothetical protein
MGWIQRNFPVATSAVGAVVTVLGIVATVTGLVAKNWALPAVMVVLVLLLCANATQHVLQSRPDIRFGEGLLVQTARVSGVYEHLGRIQIKNEGSTTEVSVKLRPPFRPNVSLTSATPTLHREGDNPADYMNYSETFRLAHGAIQAYDLVAMTVVSGQEPQFYLCLNQYQGHRYPVPLDGDYECDIFVHDYGTVRNPTQKATYVIHATRTDPHLDLTLISGRRFGQ